jgi:hypothetical protein
LSRKSRSQKAAGPMFPCNEKEPLSHGPEGQAGWSELWTQPLLKPGALTTPSIWA